MEPDQTQQSHHFTFMPNNNNNNNNNNNKKQKLLACIDLIINPFWWLACYITLPITGLIRLGKRYSPTRWGSLARANISLSRVKMIIQSIFQMWVFTHICVLAHIKRGLKCLQSNSLRNYNQNTTSTNHIKM